MQRLGGMCLTGDVSEQVFPVFYGAGANGKSTLLDTIAGLMGHYACEAPDSLRVVRQTPEHPTEIAALLGKRLVVASETESGQRLRVQLVKKLTGNARLQARFMRGDYFEFDRTHKTILVTNNKPRVDEPTHAIWRRIKLVPFEVTIPDEAQDKKLLGKLQEERPGILRWLVERCLAWQRAGELAEPGVVKMATEEYRDEENPLKDFLDNMCERHPQAWVPFADLWSEYCDYADKSHVRYPLGQRKFTQRLKASGFKPETRTNVDRKPVRGWRGLDLKSRVGPLDAALMGEAAGRLRLGTPTRGYVQGEPGCGDNSGEV